MRKLFLFFSFLFISRLSFAQLGIKIGVNASSILKEANEIGVIPKNTNARSGLNVGATYDFGKVFFLQPGIYFSQKGFNTTDTSFFSNTNQNIQFSLNYIDIPLNLILKMKIGFIKLYFGGGVVLSYGIGGKYKSSLSVSSLPGSLDIHFGDGVDSESGVYIKNPFDFGFQVGTGIEIKSFNINLSYTFGETDLYKKTKPNRFYNRTFGVTVGYLFGNYKQKE